MLTNLVLLTALLVVLLVVVGTFLAFRREDRARVSLAESLASGMNQPASLHPVIALDACIGSGACIDVCPEKVLDRVDGVTIPVFAGSCIGHGRCQAACPVDAIALVFGTAERGVDIPLLRRGYETNVDGIFVVGELGGMGLIRNAMRQGLQVVETIPNALARPELADPPAGAVDVVIVGAGPAGLAVALACKQAGLSFVLLEQFTIGGSVTHYPRRKLVFTETIKLPKVGKFGKSEMLKEELVAEFERVLLEAEIEVHEGRRVVAAEGSLGAFSVRCELEGGLEEVHAGRAIVLAIGRRGTPRKLEVPGEHLPHVVYKLVDAEQYRHRRVLCVGGGDSAVEAANSLAMTAGCEVHLSYRGEGFHRVKKKNRDELERLVREERLTLHLQTEVEEITETTVRLRGKDAQGKARKLTLEVEDVIINAGGVLPTPFLESLGVQVETKHGEIAKGSRSQRAPRVSGRVADRLSGRLGQKPTGRAGDAP